MTETLLNRNDAAEYIRKNADPACCLDALDRRTLMHWQIDDYGPMPKVIQDAWAYSRTELDDFIEIEGLKAKGIIAP